MGFFDFLMGLPGLAAFVCERYPSAVNQVDSLPNYDRIYVDMNNVIHKKIDELERNDKFNSKTLAEQCSKMLMVCSFYAIELFVNTTAFQELMDRTKAKLLFVVFDGVSPNAKRRLKSSPHAHFDRNSISPGTKEMIEIEDFIKAVC